MKEFRNLLIAVGFLLAMGILAVITFALVTEPKLLYLLMGGMIAIIAMGLISIPLSFAIMRSRDSDRQEYMAMLSAMTGGRPSPIHINGTPHQIGGPQYLDPRNTPPPPSWNWVEENQQQEQIHP